VGAPYLRIQSVTVFVRDQERSIRFFVDQLGFTLAFDGRRLAGRWVAIAPPDGRTMIALVASSPEWDVSQSIGGLSRIVFVTEDVDAKYEEWSRRGVRFLQPPHKPDWGGTFATFEDVDGNVFALVGFDQFNREIEAQRRAAVEKQEAERRAAQELEIAQQVQARLFPQTLPPLATLDYAGVCIQARQVGGDYYDFLDLGSGRLGLVVGDIAGKGIAAALLMANLQAYLRSQSAIAWAEPQRLLRSVNQSFRQNTTDSAYATLLFAEYDDRERRMLYANCGHLPGLVLRAGGGLDRLHSTSTVLGVFEDWECVTGECTLHAGDTLAFYTDGVTEAFSAAGEEFGEERLLAALRRDSGLPARALLEGVVGELRRFSAPEQHDDITLIVGRCRER
jgi:serine phosphatase RsbU (regulator of sigma subunit)/catechol 2,3-dioxygenase-like lactoylglutathione lyase family enzyme